MFLSLQGKKTAKKAAIDENTDFASLVRTNRDFVFVAQLKQAKKDSRGKIVRSHVAADSHFPREMTILKRPSEVDGLMGPFNYRALRNLQQQREKYLVSAAPVAQLPYGGPAAPMLGGIGAAVCEVCSSGEETGGVAFHCCVHDRVLVEAFRSPVGPIRRPLPQAKPFSLLS